MSEDTIRKLQAMFEAMTEHGLFDQLAAYIHPDEINEVCDAVARAGKQKGDSAPPHFGFNLRVAVYLEPAQ